MRKIIIIITLAAGLGFLLAGCQHGDSTKAKGAIASATADPTVAADIKLAEADIKRCVTGTPLQQIHTVHVLFLERAGGKNGAEVQATRAKVFGCLGVPPGQQTQFKNDSLTAAEHQHPRVLTKAGIKTYVLVTWPGILARYQHAGTGASASPSVTASS
jgi:hypothetical protein